MSGKIAVDNVLVRNPSGYYSEYLLRAGKMTQGKILEKLSQEVHLTKPCIPCDMVDITRTMLDPKYIARELQDFCMGHAGLLVLTAGTRPMLGRLK